jgi:stearoyl-CoA desaturase (Delta-9 desaturase)
VFAVLLAAAGFSITLGYHRLFSHATFRARLPVRLFTLVVHSNGFNSASSYRKEEGKRKKEEVIKSDGTSVAAGAW